jgi:hypothetical protein
MRVFSRAFTSRKRLFYVILHPETLVLRDFAALFHHPKTLVLRDFASRGRLFHVMSGSGGAALGV